MNERMYFDGVHLFEFGAVCMFVCMYVCRGAYGCATSSYD